MTGFVILNYNTWEESKQCIVSVFESNLNDDYRIYLVDNGSSVLPCEEIQILLSHEKVEYVANKSNVGYARGNNIGIEYALDDGCDSIVVSNSDVVFCANSVSIMRDYIHNNPETGIVGPRILNGKNIVQRSNMLIKTGLKQKYLFRTFLHRFLQSYNKEYRGSYSGTSPVLVHAVSGCCFMISRNCARALSPVFDENTFLYEEELILGFRMEKVGFKTVYLPESVVFHYHGSSSKNVKAFAFTEFVKSEIYYCKSYLKANVFKVLPLYLIRLSSYIVRSFTSKDFLKGFPKFVGQTILRLFSKGGLGRSNKTSA